MYSELLDTEIGSQLTDIRNSQVNMVWRAYAKPVPDEKAILDAIANNRPIPMYLWWQCDDVHICMEEIDYNNPHHVRLARRALNKE